MSDIQANDQTSDPAEREARDSTGGMTLQRMFVLGFSAFAGLFVVALVVAVLIGLGGAQGGFAGGVQVIRDVLIIFLALQGVFICVALIILVLQFAALVNLLRNELKPLMDEIRETSSAAKGTAQFVSKNVASPVIKVAATVAGVQAFFGEIIGIRRNINGK